MPRFNIRAEKVGPQDLFHLSGNIVEGAGALLRSVTRTAGKDCLFNWSGITITSSDGIREWVKFLDEFAVGRKLGFIECPPNIVISFNMIPGCIGPARVLSAYGTFVCGLCNKERWELLTLDKDLDKNGHVTRKVACEACGDDMRLNLPEDEYFGFRVD